MRISSTTTKLKQFVLSHLRPVSLSEYAKNSRVRSYTPHFVSVFYYVTPFLAFTFLSNGLLNKPNFDPIWSLGWVEWFNLESVTVILAIKLCFLAVAFLAVLTHRYRTTRLLFFIILWQVHALESSFGHWNHQWYGWLYVSGILVFLPDIWSRAELNFQRTWRALLTIWTAQAYLMLTYTMAGIHKLVMIIEQYTLGEVHGFSKEAFAYQAAWWVPQLQSPAYMLDTILAFPYIAWFAYSGIILLQLFALWCMVRVSLQLVWGVLFVLFHIGTYLSMGISFSEQLLLMCVFFLASPFSIPSFTLKDRLLDLPVLGQLLEYVGKKRRLGFLTR